MNSVVYLMVVVFCKTGLSENLDIYRLPKAVIPSHYDLLIITDLDEGQNYFKGTVSIQVDIKKNTSSVTLNVKDLNITCSHVKIKMFDGISSAKELNVVMTHLDEGNDFFIIIVEETLFVGQKYMIEIPFAGDLKESLGGYYRSSYVDKATGKIKWMAVTQFESISARRAFPCFDEPAMKSTFNISLAHKKHLKAISNMPLFKSSPINNSDYWVLDVFEKSLLMSTYLVAFMVGELESKEGIHTKDDVLFSIWTQKDAMDQVDFALDVGIRALSFYEKYFDIKFPLPKQDLVAVPDFYQGAMENWGMITFRETELLCHNYSSFETKEEIAITITHELAHQWFGNLVTMKWWSDLWLNEGFATYMEIFCTGELFPEFNTFYRNSINNLIDVMEEDSLRSSHQLSVPIHNPNEIDEVFDGISYTKGSVLIRMMVMFLSENIFRKGIINYLKAHSYSNAEQDDLWKALTHVAHESEVLNRELTVKDIMDTWTLQTGFPIITVTRDYYKNSATITQKRYLTLRNQTEDTPVKNDCWKIPLTYTTSSELNFNDTRVKVWFNSNQIIIKNIATDKDWVIFNIQFGVLYKVNYDTENWNRLATTLNDPKYYRNIITPNRVQIMNDAFDLAWDGDLHYSLAFKILNYIAHEVEYLPWSVALSSVAKISGTINRLPIYGDFKKYMSKLIKPAFQKFNGFTKISNKHEEQKMKTLIMASACNLELEGCLTEAIDLYKKWMKKHKPEYNKTIPEDYRHIVYCIAVRYGGEKEWNFLWSVFNKTNSAKHKDTIQSSLSCSREVWILNRFLFMLLDKKSGIRLQDSLTVFGGIASNKVGYYLAKDFFFNGIKEIKKIYEKAPPTLLGKFMAVLIGQLTSETEMKEMKAFLEKNKRLFAPSKMAIKQSLEVAQVSINWIKKNYNTIKNLVKSA